MNGIICPKKARLSRFADNLQLTTDNLYITFPLSQYSTGIIQRILYIRSMAIKEIKAIKSIRSLGLIPLAAYGLLLGVSSFADDPTKDVRTETVATDAPVPGSEGDTLTREDARMALLIYKLLDKEGKFRNPDLERGETLFYQNCRPCHGNDGRRMNLGTFAKPVYLGERAREDLPTFWYQMNFGDDDRNMEAYYDEFTVDEMVDIAAYAQTFE